ncbi:MAG: ABC transporter ATP-binding protein [Candidatus Bathyarchaeia archaeon]
MILRVSGVTKSFGGLTAVKEFSFSLKSKEIVGLIGPNGAGKTTLYRVIMGIYKPDSGVIEFEGRNITGLPSHKIYRLGIALTNQIPRPFKSLTLLQNVMSGLLYKRGVESSELERRAMEEIEFVGLKDKKDSKVEELSFFDLKRLELARCLVSSPKLLMVDELAAGSSESEVLEIIKLLKSINERGITLLISEHIMRLIAKVVDRVMLMDKGRKILDADVETVMKSEEMKKVYLGG